MFPAILVGLAFFVPGLWFLFLWYHSRNPENHMTTVGALTQRNTRRNVSTKFGIEPIITSFTYTYMVGGRAYRLKSANTQTKGHLAKKVTIVYLKACPRCAWIDRYPGSMHGVTALICLLAGVFMTVLAILASR